MRIATRTSGASRGLPNSQQVARAGEHFVAAELHRRGAYAVIFPGQHARIDMIATDRAETKTVTIQVKTKGESSRVWQTSIRKGDPLQPGTVDVDFWILVELQKRNSEPGYFIVPGDWIREDIRTSHQAYIGGRGGMRARTPDSTHHAIQKARVEQWRDRWDLLGLF